MFKLLTYKEYLDIVKRFNKIFIVKSNIYASFLVMYEAFQSPTYIEKITIYNCNHKWAFFNYYTQSLFLVVGKDNLSGDTIKIYSYTCNSKKPNIFEIKKFYKYIYKKVNFDY